MEELFEYLARGKEAGTLDRDEAKLAKKFFKTLDLLSENPRHNSLESHEIDVLTRRVGFKVFQSYLENRTPGAGRLFWAYGPKRAQITALDWSRIRRIPPTDTTASASHGFLRDQRCPIRLKNGAECLIIPGYRESCSIPDQTAVEVPRGRA